ATVLLGVSAPRRAAARDRRRRRSEHIRTGRCSCASERRSPARIRDAWRERQAQVQLDQEFIRHMREAVIVSAVRLPTGKFLGTLKDFPAPELGAMVVREAVRRAGIEPESVEECIMGNVVSAGAGQAPARQAALKGGLADHVAALTINKVCGSGLKAVM